MVFSFVLLARGAEHQIGHGATSNVMGEGETDDRIFKKKKRQATDYADYAERRKTGDQSWVLFPDVSAQP